MKKVTVVGAGLAGCEATWQLISKGIMVDLIEMRPSKKTPAHTSGEFAELVCSNSLRSNALTNGVGLLKAEMRLFDSLIMKVADECSLPSGSALAVDREVFAKRITSILHEHPLVNIINKEQDVIIDEPMIIATGPLTSDKMTKVIGNYVDNDFLYFYDAVAPIIIKDSIDFSIAYYKSRYDKGGDDYINLPLNKEQFFAFYHELINAKTIKLHDFEKEIFFEGCMPIEEIARRGIKTMLFGPLKPVGLKQEGKESPYAVVQLRQDNAVASLYNMVGFQTHLTYGEQQRVFKMIPGLQNAEFARLGVMHRNTYLNSPSCLRNTYQSNKRDNLFFAGQITGVEGYVESAASGLLAGINMALSVQNKELFVLPNTTMLGAMANYITNADPSNFQPMNANFGIMRLLVDTDKRSRKEAYANQSLSILKDYVKIWNDTNKGF
ncbi:MAG: methylenetetrahydrofolate--tRNA-(uracil(54)-C(5))-methyltransferase (FADH(2)-oxidizing) TrmFO [Erysipelotrichaceae bacterium]|nr:methylenetetrahydrofolate--tRNA-(uracil(54)-C(5))-methyltransferase (FADH(2)-oxidizing) TrmFO [Erysipelotrichaceae bacterium]MDD3923590.1 methylenetetrahydrofolate--tRNA-(uracil(54)-C(5))-methyltransferase (FADH(2)-oxidizing) TrmFO [Erysipelotrichaceae bacterium]MDD4642306.1 methylenetetrahydrofolate--tRNA-(uracil(54)-C(5))-methyltransferase (FADH(2)-oxidizing) TrmFO [Erysipelotrichaceae bacterium]